MSPPEQLLLSDLLRRRVRCDQGLDHGPGTAAWMHPPVHRVLGWVSRPSSFGSRRQIWRLNQLRGLGELEALVKGEPADTDQATVDRLPTLIQATLLGQDNRPLGTVVDAAIELATGAIRHYLVSRSDPRLPGSSRWRLNPERIEDQRPGQVFARLQDLDDLPLARASVRQELLRRSRRWRDQVQDLGDRFEQRVEGWLEEPPWQDSADGSDRQPDGWSERPRPRPDQDPEPWERDDWDRSPAHEGPPPRQSSRVRGSQTDRNAEDDPWI
ncbi:MAG: RNA methyltransferase [Cyanobacteriota bacterium]|nr:RNA methyltransferase [Cyanobacteriota bacterium]